MRCHTPRAVSRTTQQRRAVALWNTCTTQPERKQPVTAAAVAAAGHKRRAMQPRMSFILGRKKCVLLFIQMMIKPIRVRVRPMHVRCVSQSLTPLPAMIARRVYLFVYSFYCYLNTACREQNEPPTNVVQGKYETA